MLWQSPSLKRGDKTATQAALNQKTIRVRLEATLDASLAYKREVVFMNDFGVRHNA